MRIGALVFVAVVTACGNGTVETPRPVEPRPSAATAAPLDMAMPEGDLGARLRDAVKQMDSGQLEIAVSTLEDLHRTLPNNATVVHELGLAYRLTRQPEKAIALLTPLRSQLPIATSASLASALDEAGKGGDAQNLLHEEIARHPESGLLRSELATTILNAGKRDDALALYEEAIRVDPAFRASYLHAAEILAGTKNRGMSLLYGETFRVLEPTGDRSASVGVLMVRVCKEAVTLEGTTAAGAKAHVWLASNEMTLDQAQRGMPIANQFELAFGPGLVMANMSGLTLASLHAARRSFLDALGGPRRDTALAAMPIVRWLRALDAAGHLEAYDYWLYAPAMQDEALAWFKAHKRETDAMAEYLANHPLFPPK